MHEDGSRTGRGKVFGSADDSKQPEKKKANENPAVQQDHSCRYTCAIYERTINKLVCIYRYMRCVTYCKYRDIIFVPVHLNTIEENKIFQNKEIYKYTTEVTVCVISPLVTKGFFFLYKHSGMEGSYEEQSHHPSP